MKICYKYLQGTSSALKESPVHTIQQQQSEKEVASTDSSVEVISFTNIFNIIFQKYMWMLFYVIVILIATCFYCYLLTNSNYPLFAYNYFLTLMLNLHVQFFVFWGSIRNQVDPFELKLFHIGFVK